MSAIGRPSGKGEFSSSAETLGATHANFSNSAEGALERHYSIQEVAELWGLCENSVRDIFRDEPGIVRIQRSKSRYKRAYTTIRIPLSVLYRVHRRMSLVA
jgi:hypothetical protein